MKRYRLFPLTLMLFIVVFSVAAQETYYTKQRGVRVRAEPSTTATIVTTLVRGAAVTVVREETGSRVSGSTVWYFVTAGRYEGYIHSSLLTTVAPAAPVVSGSSGGAGSTSPALQSTPAPLVEQPVAPPAPQGASCGGASTCGQMASCEQAYACLAAGHSGLDRDKDGVPCESICPGG